MLDGFESNVTYHHGTPLSLLLRKRYKISSEPYQHYYEDFVLFLSAPYVDLQTEGNQYQYNVKENECATVRVFRRDVTNKVQKSTQSSN